MNRTEFLVAVVADVLREYVVWSNDAHLDGIPITGPFAKAIGKMFAAFGYGDVPQCCRAMTKEVEAAQPLWDAWVARAEATDLGAHSIPPKAFFSCLAKIEGQMRTVDNTEAPKLPPPKHYWEQENIRNPAQIAVIYDWYDAKGQPDTARVLRELANPSPEFADGVPNPLNVRRQRLQAEQESQMQLAAATRAARASTKDAPETIEELVAQGLTPQQIAVVKDQPLDAIERILADMGALPAESQPVVAAADNADDDEPLSIEEQILAEVDAMGEDYDVKTIADLLNVSPQKVRAVVKRRVEVTGASGS